MEIIIKLIGICVLFYILLRYELSLPFKKAILHAILFTLIVGVLYLSFSYKEYFDDEDDDEDDEEDGDEDADDDDNNSYLNNISKSYDNVTKSLDDLNKSIIG